MPSDELKHLSKTEATRLDVILALVQDDPEQDITITARTLCAFVESHTANLRGLLAECLALNPMVSGNMEKVREWAEVVRRMREEASHDEKDEP